ncbi:hypothetical protein [Streptomyces filamentosus]|uniref:hypothetical protein n=1 Tax=Streptomyces filamentosus TaxID=67294 RepID=UPI00123A2DFD|nr:hypothetical protein [Streptomyces filamentosus]KAA6211696.1 hypothetical protein CP979_35550 [Streptomyces filamentosus]
MPLPPEEPQIHESAQGPSATTATGRPAPTPRPVPGPRSAASPRPGRPGPGPARPAPPAPRPVPGPPAPKNTQENRSGGAQLQFIPASADGALDAAEEALDLLLDSGRQPGEVLVLTTGERHPWAAHELSFGEAAYWAQQDTAEDVFFADAASAERVTARPVVIVAVNGDDETAARVLPLALSRAGALLVVCGDPQKVTAVLGAGV